MTVKSEVKVFAAQHRAAPTTTSRWRHGSLEAPFPSVHDPTSSSIGLISDSGVLCFTLPSFWYLPSHSWLFPNVLKCA